MPIYEYRCLTTDCEGETEKLRSYKQADEPVECPECKGTDMKRIVSVSSFSLKGGGWANDGYS